MNKPHPVFLALLIVVTFLTSCGQDDSTLSTLSRVKKREKLLCGIHGNIRGFSYGNKKTGYSGIDVDFCRAVAAALFNDPNKIEFIRPSSKDRFVKVSKGDIDLLNRNVTWTLNRDTITMMEFAPPLFYDISGIMATKKSGIKKTEDLKGKSICIVENTTAEQNLKDEMSKIDIKDEDYTIVPFKEIDDVFENYKKGGCDAIFSDRSLLFARRYDLPKREDEHLIFPVGNSIEPLSPVVADGDSTWFDIVKWIDFTLIKAEELGITSKNLSSFETTKDPKIRRFLGMEGNLGEDLGLTNDFAVRIIRHVGNYGEIYERNIGEPLKLERGLNKLWKDKGLLYSPPFR